MDMTNATTHQRKVIYQARRGLKELDYYIDPYVKNHYLNASDDQQQAFERLLGYEDPDLLLFFLGQAKSDDDEVMTLIDYMKALKHS